jgi:hypothetical protein
MNGEGSIGAHRVHLIVNHENIQKQRLSFHAELADYHTLYERQ